MQPARKQLRPSEAIPPKSLADEFLASAARTEALAEQLVEQHVDYLKAVYQDLPRETLMLELTKFRQDRIQVGREVVELERQRAEFNGEKP
jgi:hypothetical protein